MNGAAEARNAVRVFIADDEAPARARVKELLADIRPSIPTTVAGEAANGLEVIERLPGSGTQVLLLDIQMPGMGGLELARHLGGLESAPAIVFVTAHDRHAVEAFELNALDYLMKPVRAERLAAALKKAAAAGPALRERLERAASQANSGAREFFSVTERNRIVLVPVGEVLFLKAELKYVTLRTKAGEHLIEEPLVSIEREFAERFVRVHRNCLVARAAIRGFERSGGADGGEDEPGWNVVLEGMAERLPVSRRQWPVVKSLLPEARE